MRKRMVCPFALLAAGLGLACGDPAEPAVIGMAFVFSQDPIRTLVDEDVRADSAAPSIRLQLTVNVESLPGVADLQLEEAVRAARTIVGVRNLVGVVGHVGSRDALLAAPMYQGAGVPVIVPTATSSLLREASEWVLPLAPSDVAEGAFLADFAVLRFAPRTAAVVYVSDEYGLGLRDGIVAGLERAGVSTSTLRVPAGQPCNGGYRHLLTGDAVGRPDIVVLAVRHLEAGCVLQVLRPRLPGSHFLAGDGVDPDEPEFFHRAGAAAESLFVAAFWHPDAPDSASRRFVERFQGLTGHRPVHGEAMTYDAVMVLVDAVRHAGSDPRQVLRYLRSLGTSRPAFAGITGSVTFDPDKREPLVMTWIRNGRWELFRVE